MDGVNGAVVGETSAVRRLQQVGLIPLERNPHACWGADYLKHACNLFCNIDRIKPWVVGLLRL